MGFSFGAIWFNLCFIKIIGVVRGEWICRRVNNVRGLLVSWLL